MRLIVTRVQPQAQQWAQALCTSGHDAVALPLIETRGLQDTSAIRQASLRLADYAAVMFVSAHAVNHFYKENKALALTGKAQAAISTRAWATGPGTSAALATQGVPVHLTDAPVLDAGQFDSENLWWRVHTQIHPGTRVLIVRGDTPGSDEPAAQGVGRDWLAQQLRQAGAQVDFVVAYQRGAPQWDADQLALAAAAATNGAAWIFSSAEALGNLQTLLPGQDWSLARAVATHARIALAARRLGFGTVLQASPTLPSVLASVESLP
jgi:uroporphyrinogen-III synthase